MAAQPPTQLPEKVRDTITIGASHNIGRESEQERTQAMSDKAKATPATSDKYAAERYNPTLAHCASLHLTFNGKTLEMSGGKKPYSYPAVSGKRDAKGKFDYSSARQKLSNTGPIPEGVYWVQPAQPWDAWYKLGSTDAWGDNRRTIHPFTTTTVHGRGDFFIHGGKVPESAGCIDLTSSINDFVRDLKTELGGLPPCQIHLKIKY